MLEHAQKAVGRSEVNMRIHVSHIANLDGNVDLDGITVICGRENADAFGKALYIFLHAMQNCAEGRPAHMGLGADLHKFFHGSMLEAGQTEGEIGVTEGGKRNCLKFSRKTEADNWTCEITREGAEHIVPLYIDTKEKLDTFLSDPKRFRSDVVILTCPENGLHPERQIQCAEKIVAIQKELGILVALNTNSPYFVEAVELYTKKYGTAPQCKMYLLQTDGRACSPTDVTKDLEQIYAKFAKPMEELDRIRAEQDEERKEYGR